MRNAFSIITILLSSLIISFGFQIPNIQNNRLLLLTNNPIHNLNRLHCSSSSNSTTTNILSSSSEESIVPTAKRKRISFQTRLQQLQKFKSIHGHVNVPRQHPELGIWIHNQRILQRKGKLSNERRDALEQMGLDWDPNNTRWWKHFHDVVRKNAGTTNLDKEWIERQKKEYRIRISGGRSTLTPEKERALLSVFGEDWRDEKMRIRQREQQQQPSLSSSSSSSKQPGVYFYQRIEQIRQYKNQFGNVNIPRKAPDPYSGLGIWISNQKKQYTNWVNGKRSSMNEEKLALLRDVGLEWEEDEDHWDAFFEKLKRYKQKYGDCNVPLKYDEQKKTTFDGNESLGSWLVDQRRQYWRMRDEMSPHDMTEKRVKKLEGLGFHWDILEDSDEEERGMMRSASAEK